MIPSRNISQISLPENAVFIARTKKVFARAVDLLGPQTQLLLATADGMAVATHNDDEELSARFAALSCALLSLSESFSGEVLGVTNNEISVSSDGGHAVLLRLALRGHPYLVCLSTKDHTTNLATALRLTRDVGKKLSSIVNY